MDRIYQTKKAKYILILENWIQQEIEGQLWGKYDDLHIDEIDSDFNNKKLHSIFIQPVIKFMNLL